MNLLGYIRCSADDRGERHSVDVQERMIREYCRLYGHTLVDIIIDDGVSGGTDIQKRSGGAMLLRRLEEHDGGAEGVVAREIERLFRRTINGLVTAEWFESRGLALHFVTEKIDTSDPDGFFFLTLKLGLAERERRKAQVRGVQVSNSLRSEARVYGGIPYGCIECDGRLYRDPETWQHREHIVRLRRVDRLSFRAIAAALEDDDITPPGGGRRWAISTIRSIVEGHHTLEHIPLADDVTGACGPVLEAVS